MDILSEVGTQLSPAEPITADTPDRFPPQYAAVLYPDLSLQSLPAPRSLRRQAAVSADVDDDDMDRLRNGDDEGAASSSTLPQKASSPSPPPQASTAVKEEEEDIEAELRAELAELKKGGNGSRAGGGPSKGQAAVSSREAQEATVPALRLFDTNTECGESPQKMRLNSQWPVTNRLAQRCSHFA